MSVTYPKPFAADILDSASAGRTLLTAASAAAQLAAISGAGTSLANTFTLAQQFNIGSNTGTVSTTEKTNAFFTNISGLKWNESLGWVSAGASSYPAHYQGFNILSTGRVDTGMSAIWTQTEHDYNDPSEGVLSEWHVNYQNSSGAGSRAIFVKFHASTAGGWAVAGAASVELRGEITLGTYLGGQRLQVPNDLVSPIQVAAAGFNFQTNNVAALRQRRAADANSEVLIMLDSSDKVSIAAAFGGGVILNGNTKVFGNVAFNGTEPIAKPTVTGSRGGNAALASLCTALANYGLITDSTS